MNLVNGNILEFVLNEAEVHPAGEEYMPYNILCRSHLHVKLSTEILAALQRQAGKWKSVKEELPKNHGLYIIQCDNNSFYVSMFSMGQWDHLNILLWYSIPVLPPPPSERTVEDVFWDKYQIQFNKMDHDSAALAAFNLGLKQSGFLASEKEINK